MIVEKYFCLLTLYAYQLYTNYGFVTRYLKN
jgi:hypothetical protein